MTEHKHPDDGGPAYPLMVGTADRIDNVNAGMSLRARLAMHFAAAWLPIVTAETKGIPEVTPIDVYKSANGRGLAMADDLLRRLRENT